MSEDEVFMEKSRVAVFMAERGSITGLGFLTLLVLFVDQVTKAWVMANLGWHEVYPVVPGFFNLVYITNTGAAFGFLAGAEHWRYIFFQVISVFAFGVLFYLYRSGPRPTRALFLGCALVSGGALGNLVDRLRYRAVVDFLDFHVSGYHWPAFNVADTAITVGAAFLAWHFLKNVS